MKEENIVQGWSYSYSFTGAYGQIRNAYDAIAHIRCNKTGEIVKHSTQIFMNSDGTPNVFNWEENNFSCDCNRGQFFYEEKGINGYEESCGEELYSVNLSNPVDGSIFYREFDDYLKEI